MKKYFRDELHPKNVRLSNLPNRDVIKNRHLREEDFENAPSRSKMRPQPYENCFCWGHAHRPSRKVKYERNGPLRRLIASFTGQEWDASYSILCQRSPRRTWGRVVLEDALTSTIEHRNTEWTHRKYGLRDGVLLSREEYSKDRWTKVHTLVKIGRKYYGHPDYGRAGRESWYELDLVTLDKNSDWDMNWQKDYFLGHYYDAEKALAFYGDADLCCRKLYQVYDRRILRKIAEVSDRY